MSNKCQKFFAKESSEISTTSQPKVQPVLTTSTTTKIVLRVTLADTTASRTPMTQSSTTASSSTTLTRSTTAMTQSSTSTTTPSSQTTNNSLACQDESNITFSNLKIKERILPCKKNIIAYCLIFVGISLVCLSIAILIVGLINRKSPVNIETSIPKINLPIEPIYATIRPRNPRFYAESNF